MSQIGGMVFVGCGVALVGVLGFELAHRTKETGQSTRNPRTAGNVRMTDVYNGIRDATKGAMTDERIGTLAQSTIHVTGTIYQSYETGVNVGNAYMDFRDRTGASNDAAFSMTRNLVDRGTGFEKVLRPGVLNAPGGSKRPANADND